MSSHARDETLTALDFISFLLSKHMVTAQNSMSPVLKEAVPTGSLDSRVIKSAPASASEESKIDQVRRRWKMHSFASAAEKISSTGVKLQEEAGRESKYWEQVSSLKAKGWAVSRLPRDSRTVGVHFGFSEAAPSFRSRGFAVLRRGQDGNIRLDCGLIPAKPAAIKVTISRNGHEAGSSIVRKPQVTDESPIEEQISQAQDTLADEELFHEIGREGRLLANQGVLISANSVKFSVGDDLEVQIHLVNPDAEPNAFDANAPSNDIAEAIAVSLRILLVYAHQRNLQWRSEPPPPMTLKPRSIPEYALLRPVICLMQHVSHLNSLRAFTATSVPPMHKAGLDVKAEFNVLSQLTLPVKEAELLLHPKALLEPLIAPLESNMIFGLFTKRKLELKIKTYLGPPIFGTVFIISPLNYGTNSLSPPRLETITDVESFLRHVLMVDVTSFIEELSASDRSHDKEQSTVDPAAQPSWRVTELHLGELSLQKQRNAIKKLQVKVWRNRLGLRYVSETAQGSSDLITWIWEARKCWKVTSEGREEEVEQLLPDVIKELLEATAAAL